MAQGTISDAVTVGGTPGTPNGQRGGGGLVGSMPARRATLNANPRKEYVSSDPYQAYVNYARALPRYTDELTRDFGLDVYRKMLNDDAVASAIGTLQTQVLEDGVHLTSAISDKTDPRFDLAATITKDAERMLADLETPLDAVLWDMTRAFAYGHRVAEQVYTLQATASTGKRQLALTALKVKPPTATAFVVDATMNVLGLLGMIPGVGYPVMTGLLMDNLADVPNLIPRDKFAILSIRTEANDPRGTSLLRPAYQAYYDKISLAPEFIKYLVQFGTPSLAGILGPDARPLVGPDGLPLVGSNGQPLDPQLALNQALIEFRNSSVLALPNGSDVKVIESTGQGAHYLDAFDACDRRINQAIQYQTLASLEGKHQARASSSTHENRLDTLVAQLKQTIVGMLTRDVLRQWVRLNRGDAAARDLTPTATLGTPQQEDQTAEMKAWAVLGYRLAPSQLRDVDARLGLTPRTDDEMVIPAQETVLVSEDAGTVTPPDGGEESDADEPATDPTGNGQPGNPPADKGAAPATNKGTGKGKGATNGA